MPNCLTQHFDNARTGWNPNETKLTVANVPQLRKLFTLQVDGTVYAQPLYLENVEVPGKGVHNVVYVATENDTIYAFDADTDQPPLWNRSLIPPGESVVSWHDIDSNNIVPVVGITSTPVIDLNSRTIYVTAKTKRVKAGSTTFHWYLHAVDVATGADKPGSPVEIQASFPGTSQPNDGHGNVLFSPQWHLSRPGLLLANGMVYIAFGSHGDAHAGTYHGWVLGFNAATLRHVSTFNATPDNATYGAGIWQGGMGPASDSAGSVYFTTGNGSFNATKELNVLRTVWKTSTDPDADWTAWAPFAPDPGAVTYVATGQLEDGRLQLWAVGVNGQLKTAWKASTDPDAAWSAWAPFDPDPGAVTYVATGKLEDGRLQLWVVGGNGQLKSAWKTSTDPNAAWSAWQLPFGPDPGPVAYVATGQLEDGRLQLWVVNTGGRNYGDTVLKLRPDLTVASYFTPADQTSLLLPGDVDLGSGGVLSLPDQPGSTHPQLLVTCGKDGDIFLLDRNHLGGYTGPGGNNPQAVQTLPLQPGVPKTSQPGVWGGPAYYRGPNGHFVYYCGNGGRLTAFLLQGGLLSPLPNQSPQHFPREGGTTPTVSSNQQVQGTAVVWAIARDDPLRLLAFDATNLTRTLFEGNCGPWDNPHGGAFIEPTVVNGKVYVGSDGQLNVFGL